MSLIAMRKRPPVSATHQLRLAGRNALLLTISMYSCSVGHVRLSRQNRSMPCPRCSLNSSSDGQRRRRRSRTIDFVEHLRGLLRRELGQALVR